MSKGRCEVADQRVVRIDTSGKQVGVKGEFHRRFDTPRGRERVSVQRRDAARNLPSPVVMPRRRADELSEGSTMAP